MVFGLPLEVVKSSNKINIDFKFIIDFDNFSDLLLF